MSRPPLRVGVIGRTALRDLDAPEWTTVRRRGPYGVPTTVTPSTGAQA
jgi:hypothetical protein